MMNNLKETLQ
ncbi:hypothetical protein Nmel_011660 [Mimus melanotis]